MPGVLPPRTEIAGARWRWFLITYFILLALTPLDRIFPVVSYFGELFEIFCFSLAGLNVIQTGRIQKKWAAITVFLFLFLILSILFGKNRSVFDIAIQGLIYLKLPVFYFTLAYVFNKYPEALLRRCEKYCYYFLALSLAGALVNIVWSGYYDFFGLERDYRLGDLVPRISGLQMHPNQLARTLFLLLIVVFIGDTVRLKTKYLLFAVVGCFIYLTGSRTAIFLMLITPLFYMLAKSRDGANFLIKVSLVSAILLVFVALLGDTWILSKTTQNLASIKSIDDSSYIRGIMIYEGFKGALDNFPIGWGLASFGTPLSIDSVVYDKIGLSGSVYLLEGRGIFDSNFASALGETGFLGGLFFFYFILVLSKPYSSNGVRSDYYLSFSILTILSASFLVAQVFGNDYFSMITALVISLAKAKSLDFKLRRETACR